MKLKLIHLSFLSWFCHLTVTAQVKSPVPDTLSKAPDYYCTWNLQGFVSAYSSGSGSNDLRMEIHEDNLFGTHKVWEAGIEKKVYNGTDKSGKKTKWSVLPAYQGWTNHYPSIQRDLIFVMDDSWDIPKVCA